VVLRALAKKPADRYQSAQEMRTALLNAVMADYQLEACRACDQPVGPVKFCPHCGASQRPDPPPRRHSLRHDSQPPAKQRAARTTALRPTRASAEASAAVLGTVGREPELERLLSFWGGAGEGRGVVLVGPTGIGKTTLALEAATRASSWSLTFVVAPDPSGLKQPWYPVLGMIEAILELQAPLSLDELSRAAARYGLPDRDVPGLAELFGLDSPLGQLELAVRRREAFSAALRALGAATRVHSCAVLCFLDVDRYDAPSREIIEQLLAKDEEKLPRLVITMSDGAPLEGAEVMMLESLANGAAEELLVGRMRNADGMLSQLADASQLAGGHPGFIEHLAAWLADGNRVSAAPPALVDLVAARVGQLPKGLRSFLQAVAIHGQFAPRHVVEGALGATEVSRAAPSLVQRGLLVEEAHGLYIKSAVVADVVLSATPVDVRRRLSEAALELMSASAAPAVLARHAERCEQLEQAAGQYIRAGDDAVHRFDDHGAVERYWRAVTCARRLEALGGGPDSQAMLDASLRLADVLRYTGEPALALGCLDEADGLAARPAEQAGLARARGRTLMALDRPVRAVTYLRRAVGHGIRAGDRGFLCETYIDLAKALGKAGRTTDAINELREGIDVITLGAGLDSDDVPPRFWLLALRLAEQLLEAGRLGEAEAVSTGALRYMERSESLVGTARLHTLLAAILDRTGHRRQAQHHRGRALDVMRRLGDRKSTAELLLAAARASHEMEPLGEGAAPADHRDRSIALAQALAVEIGWADRSSQGRQAST
jgi:serine/threonine-protein kinase